MSRKRKVVAIDPEHMKFHDHRLQAAYEATKHIFDRARDAAAWREPPRPARSSQYETKETA